MKKYSIQYNIGSAKYVINYHDGVDKHKDGSEFWGIILFNNKRKFNKRIAELQKEGYIEK